MVYCRAECERNAKIYRKEDLNYYALLYRKHTTVLNDILIGTFIIIVLYLRVKL